VDFNRNVQSQQSLDDAIQKYLTVISPHLQQRSALESLEWLIYRYGLHCVVQSGNILLSLNVLKMEVPVKSRLSTEGIVLQAYRIFLLPVQCSWSLGLFSLVLLKLVT
jgi:hypothetical protein